MNPLHVLSSLLIGGDFVLLARAWRVLHEAQRAAPARDERPLRVRNRGWEPVWFPSGDPFPRVERTGQGFRAVFSTPGTHRGAFTIVGGHRSNDVYPLIVTVTER